MQPITRASVLLAFLASVPLSGAGAAPVLQAPRALLLGEASSIRITGAMPGSQVRVHALREVTLPATETMPARPQRLHAWADFRADRRGRVEIDRLAPLAGTWTGADPLGLLWSGWPAGAPALAGIDSERLGAELLAGDRLVVTAEVDGSRLAPVAVPLLKESPGLIVRELTVARDGVSGVFAAPASGRRRPAVIDLHGSEGGSMAQARGNAVVLASRGYAVLALNYVAYAFGGGGIDGVPDVFINLPVELLDRARAALSRQREADPRRIALLGGSKGAELALIAGANLPWIRSIVACVPSDIVWEGFGRAPQPGEALSSWSLAGRALPYVSYDRYEDVFAGKATALDVHLRSRARATPAQLAAARIEVERIRAPVLLLGADKDQLWPSSEMARTVAATLRARRGAAAVELATYAGARHQICGTGAAPARSGSEDRAATARANGDAFRRTLAFLKRTLR